MGSSLVVSVVSHGHGAHIQRLLECLASARLAPVSRVVLTLNIPEAEPQAPVAGWPFALEIRRNAQPLGFGCNHNRALASAREPFVCVINPDVFWSEQEEPLQDLLALVARPGLALAYPRRSVKTEPCRISNGSCHRCGICCGASCAGAWSGVWNG